MTKCWPFFSAWWHLLRLEVGVEAAPEQEQLAVFEREELPDLLLDQ